MRTSECDIVMVPDRINDDPNHWQNRWQEKLAAARHLPGETPRESFDDWQGSLLQAVGAAQKPVVLVAHGIGVNLTVLSAGKFDPAIVKGAFLVAPIGSRFVLEQEDLDHRLAHLPNDPLPFAATVIASRNDPTCPILEAEEWAFAWGASFADAGDSGHLDPESGHGPWPEGLMRFAGFLNKL
jgi:predicted alpha/beta hydrolase family esterase